MNYGIIKDGLIANIIVCDSSEQAAKIGAVSLIEGAKIGDEYIPFDTEEEQKPVVEPTAAKMRENAYNTKQVVEWDGAVITVTEASNKWQYYAAEGNTEKAGKLTELIAEAKASIRKQYPDEEVCV